MANPYVHADWMAFRAEVIKIDGGRCVRCSRGRSDGVVLQVHHKRYLLNRMPWDYDYSDCETLCKGCHAVEHGKIMPLSGWYLQGSDDLGDLIGNCEWCDTQIRYVYAIIHPTWGSMAVGTDCCDKLTESEEASKHHKEYVKNRDKLKRFLSSSRWHSDEEGNQCIKRGGLDAYIKHIDGQFFIKFGPVQGKMAWPTLLDAKIGAFNLIESGIVAEYLADRAVRLAIRESESLSHDNNY